MFLSVNSRHVIDLCSSSLSKMCKLGAFVFTIWAESGTSSTSVGEIPAGLHAWRWEMGSEYFSVFLVLSSIPAFGQTTCSAGHHRRNWSHFGSTSMSSQTNQPPKPSCSHSSGWKLSFSNIKFHAFPLSTAESCVLSKASYAAPWYPRKIAIDPPI